MNIKSQRNVLYFFVVLLLLISCAESANEGRDVNVEQDIILSDIVREDVLFPDIGASKKSVKISVRSNFPSNDEEGNVIVARFYGEPDIIPEDKELVYKTEWETNKTLSLLLDENEGILAFIDRNNDKILSEGDYFGLIKPQELEDGGRYILSINSYIPFERKGDQGLNGNEIAVFERILDGLFTAKGLSMLITKIGDEYYVYSKRGTISFKRILISGKYEYPVTIIKGVNPIENTNELALATYQEEIAAGKNPEGTQYTSAGYSIDDERISFLEESDTSYPFAYERIAQIFDDPNAGDIIGLLEPYGDGMYEIGAHGHLDVTQSRSPLVFSGKGVKKGIVYEKAVRAVDIAPTLIKAMGGSKIIGVNKYNILSKENYLRRQDGDVIEDILDGEIPEYAIIIVSDGLSHTEFQRALQSEDYNIPNLKSLLNNGVYFKYGHITNYFSVTIPSHTTIGTGVYAGHHGIVNNLYYLREKGRLLTLIDLGIGPSQYLREEVETIFEAYHRNFGRYDARSNKNGRFSASINEPCTRGATYATLESLIYNFSSYKYEPLPIIEELKQVTSADNTAVNQMIYLFEKKEFPLPNLVMINLTSTDGAGHGWGPHSDMIKRVLEQTDFRIGKIIELYKNAGIFDKTLFVFTADHGMEIQDKNRSFEYKIDGTNVTVPLLDSFGVKYVGGLPFIYFETMAYNIDKPLATGELTYKFYVYDEDRWLPVKNANVKIEQKHDFFECNTDEKGECSITVLLNAGDVRLRIEHYHYNYIEEIRCIK